MKKAYQIYVMLFVFVFPTSASEILPISKTDTNGEAKSSMVLMRELGKKIASLESKDSLLKFSYIDYCIDSILFQGKDNNERRKLMTEILNNDSLVTSLSSKQKDILVEKILNEKYYDSFLWGDEYDYVNELKELPIYEFLLKNECEQIRDSVRTAYNEINNLINTQLDYDKKFFYENFLLDMHDNVLIDSVFHDMMIISQLKKEANILELEYFIPLSMNLNWFKYRKEEFFDVISAVLQTKSKIYIFWDSQESNHNSHYYYYESLEHYLIKFLIYNVENFPKNETKDLLKLKFKRKSYLTYSDEYKQQVIKWMQKHRSDYVLKIN